MPPAIQPPCYRFLLQELARADADGEPYGFTHFVVLSKAYRERSEHGEHGERSDADASTSAGSSKKARKHGKRASSSAVGRDESEIFYFHPEDEVLRRHALAYGEFAFEREEQGRLSDGRRGFLEAGIEPVGEVVVVEWGRLEGCVRDLEGFVGGAEGDGDGG